MRKLMIAAALVSTALATPAVARDGSAYVGIDAGVVKPSSLDLRFTNSAVSVDNGERLRHKWGYDVDAVFGYDFGMFRLEGEFGYKHASLKSATVAPAALAAVLIPAAPTTYGSTGRSNVLSGMVNALLDLGPSDGLNGSIGVGIGEARAKYRAGLVPSNSLSFTSSDSALAYQALAEIRVPVSQQIDVGLKGRYFETSKLKFGPFCETTCTPALPYRLSGRYKSFSVLASLLFNFGAAAPPPPPPPAPPPPPPPTQPP